MHGNFILGESRIHGVHLMSYGESKRRVDTGDGVVNVMWKKKSKIVIRTWLVGSDCKYLHGVARWYSSLLTPQAELFYCVHCDWRVARFSTTSTGDVGHTHGQNVTFLPTFRITFFFHRVFARYPTLPVNSHVQIFFFPTRCYRLPTCPADVRTCFRSNRAESLIIQDAGFISTAAD